MLLPEFLEELFYVKKVNLFESPFSVGLIQRIDPNFKNYLKKVHDYSFLNLQKWLIKLDSYYTIQELKNLKQLNLSHDELKTIPTLNLPNLQSLNLNDNQLTSIQNLNLPNLQYLYLNNNQLTELHNLNLPKLQTLLLDNNRLKEISTLSLPNLLRLYIWNNQLTNKSIGYLRSLNIQYLYLH